MPHVVGSLEVYEQQTVWPIVVDKTELMVFWGCDPVLTNQISWSVADTAAMRHEGAQGQGAKVICIDPVKTDTAEFFAPSGSRRDRDRRRADARIAHTLVAEKLHDEKFLKTYANGFDKFLPYLMGDEDRRPRAPNGRRRSATFRLTRSRISRAASPRTAPCSPPLVAAAPAIREQRHWMLVTLAAMLGQIGLPGAGSASLSLRQRRRAVGRCAGADRHHRRGKAKLAPPG